MAGGGPPLVWRVRPEGGGRASATFDRAIPVLHAANRATHQHFATMHRTARANQTALRPTPSAPGHTPPLGTTPFQFFRAQFFRAQFDRVGLGGRRGNRWSGTCSRSRHGVYLSSGWTESTGQFLSGHAFFLINRGPPAARASPPVANLPIPSFRTVVPL